MKKCIIILLVGISLILIIKSNKKDVYLDFKDINNNSSIALFIEENGKYKEETNIPKFGYTLNTSKSKCNNGAKVSFIDNKFKISNLENDNTSCYLYFDISESKKTLDKLGITLGEGEPDFSKTACLDGCEQTDTNGVYATLDDFGTSYYYRGTLSDETVNNWVKFGKENGVDIWWRIIRFNGNGTIRLIYAGAKDDTTAPATTGTTTQIDLTKVTKSDGQKYNLGTLAFNTIYNNEKYVKYKLDNGDSTIKEALDLWYKQNLATTYGDKIDGTTGFCNDADKQDSKYFKPYNRIFINYEPTLMCETPKINLFTVSGEKGNNLLSYSIGLITADEVSFAGGKMGTSNTDYWLYTNQYYWTMSPCYFLGGYASVFRVYDTGNLYSSDVNSSYGVRPVINLKADLEFTGNGTTTSPYEVKEV